MLKHFIAGATYDTCYGRMRSLGVSGKFPGSKAHDFVIVTPTAGQTRGDIVIANPDDQTAPPPSTWVRV